MFQSRVKKRFMENYEPIHGRFERFCTARAFGIMDGKDLMHDSIVIALEKMDAYQQNASFLSFLCGIAIRVLANQRRKKKEITLDEQHHDKGVNGAHDLNFEIEQLYKALAQLPEAMNEALVLFEITGFSIKEIAELQATSEDAVKQRLVRGRKQLAVLLSKEDQLTIAG